jgi:Zn-finger nucleic acid-binding protein
MCPNCKEPMIVLDWQGVEIDMCPSCGGVWLDLGELELICEQAGADPGPLAEALEKAGQGEATKRQCPRCSKKLRAISAGEQKRVELDRCPRGHGIWFDRGEMQSFVGSFEEGERGAVARFFADLFRDQLDSTKKGE